MMHNTITVLGAGYVGLTTAALLAHAGYKVYAIEPNKKRLDVIKTGKSFFFEEGLDPVIKQAIDNGNLIPTDSYEESVPRSSIVFSCVGTPDNPDGSSNLTYVFSAAEQAASLMEEGAIYVQKSTVPVRTGERVVKLFESLNKNLPYVSNPEFLREGTALYDTLFFDRVVVGGSDKGAVNTILDTYRALESARSTIAALANVKSTPRKGKYIATSLNSAELIKVSANAFLALKISFANSIAKLADKVDADVVEVMDAVGADERIGRAFLNAGRGYGGGCFPKDVSGLISSGLENGIDLEIMQAAQLVNRSMPGYVVEKLKKHIGELSDKKVAVLGLAFKSGTSDVRKSPGVSIANVLSHAGAQSIAYDPQANGEAKEDLRRDVILVEEPFEAIKDADAVIIATEWAEFTQLNLEKIALTMRVPVLLDAVNIIEKSSAESAGLDYIGVGR
jgi:UDPglucose 6-dehydrogenase